MNLEAILRRIGRCRCKIAAGGRFAPAWQNAMAAYVEAYRECD